MAVQMVAPAHELLVEVGCGGGHGDVLPGVGWFLRIVGLGARL